MFSLPRSLSRFGVYGAAVLLAAVAAIGPAGTAQAWVDTTPNRVDLHVLGGNAGGTGGWIPSYAGAVRLWDSGNRWSNIEPGRGVFDFAWTDKLVNNSRYAHKPVLLTLGQTPKWASSNPGDTRCAFYSASRRQEAGYEAGQCHAPKKMTDWDGYVRAVVKHYKGRIEAYEVWNEANLTQFWRGNMTQLATMTKHATSIIHAVDPKAKVLSPSVIFVQSAATRGFVQNLTNAGGLRGVNGVAVHLYHHGVTDAPEANVAGALALRAQLNKRGIKAPLWNTESGFRWNVKGQVASATVQRRLTARSWLVANYLRLPRSYYYSNNSFLSLNTRSTYGGTAAEKTVYQLRRWYTGASIKSCVHGPEGKMSFDIWQCTFSYGKSGKSYRYGQVRWSTGGTYAASAPAGTSQVEYIGAAARRAGKGTRVTVSQNPVLVRFTSRTPPNRAITTPAPRLLTPVVRSEIAAPSRISLYVPKVVSSGTKMHASAVVRRADIGAVVPFANVRICSWSTSTCVKKKSNATGRVGYTFPITYGGSISVESSDSAMKYAHVQLRVEARPVLTVSASGRTLKYRSNAANGQRYWVLRKSGSRWLTVKQSRISNTATMSLHVAPGTYRFQTGSSSRLQSSHSRVIGIG